MTFRWTSAANSVCRTVRKVGNVALGTAVRSVLLARNAMALIGLVLVSFAITEGTRVATPDEVTATVEPAVAVAVRHSTAGRTADAARIVLARYVSRRYRVAQDAAEQIVGDAFRTGRQVGLDPLVILAVIAVESGFNPFAQSEAGAKGLMQVMPRIHAGLLREHGGERVVLDPPTNILVGARILKSYVSITGSVEAGLQYYSGSGGTETGEYAQKVLAERARLEERLQGGGEGLRTEGESLSRAT